MGAMRHLRHAHRVKDTPHAHGSTSSLNLICPRECRRRHAKDSLAPQHKRGLCAKVSMRERAPMQPGVRLALPPPVRAQRKLQLLGRLDLLVDGSCSPPPTSHDPRHNLGLPRRPPEPTRAPPARHFISFGVVVRGVGCWRLARGWPVAWEPCFFYLVELACRRCACGASHGTPCTPQAGE